MEDLQTKLKGFIQVLNRLQYYYLRDTFYRSQWKVMFSEASVSHSAHRGDGGVCLQRGLPTEGSASRRSASGSGLPPGGSAYRGVCIQEVCLWERSASRGVCLQGDLPTEGSASRRSASGSGMPPGGGLPQGGVYPRWICSTPLW